MLTQRQVVEELHGACLWHVAHLQCDGNAYLHSIQLLILQLSRHDIAMKEDVVGLVRYADEAITRL